MAYNTTTGVVGTVTTVADETVTVTSFDLATTDGIDYQDCAITVDAEINGNVLGGEGFIGRKIRLAIRQTGDVSLIGSTTNMFAVASANLAAASFDIAVTGSVISLNATGVNGYTIEWRGDLKLRVN